MAAIARLVQNRLLAHHLGRTLKAAVGHHRGWVNNGHVEALARSVLKKDAMETLPKLRCAPVGHRDIADATNEGDPGASALDVANCVDEILGAGNSILIERLNGAVEDDVLSGEVKLVAEEAVSLLADAHLVREVRELTILLHGHDDDGG